MTVTIDKTGRVLIPQELRDELDIGEGTSLELITEGKRLILEPKQPEGELIWKGKVPVWRSNSGQVLTQEMVNEYINEIREGRWRDQDQDGQL